MRWAKTSPVTMKLRATVLAALALAAFSTSCNKPSDGRSEAAAQSAPALEGRRIEITAGPEGYKPSAIEAKKGESLVLRFTRTTKGECLAQVEFPEQKIKKDLPLNTPVEIGIKADKEGKIPFQCGMAMVFGSINVTGS
jgi:plastocyanin domain-containing protein